MLRQARVTGAEGPATDYEFVDQGTLEYELLRHTIVLSQGHTWSGHVASSSTGKEPHSVVTPVFLLPTTHLGVPMMVPWFWPPTLSLALPSNRHQLTSLSFATLSARLSLTSSSANAPR